MSGGLLDGYSGMLIFAGLLWLGHTNKPACFWACVVLGALMLTGAL